MGGRRNAVIIDWISMLIFQDRTQVMEALAPAEFCVWFVGVGEKYRFEILIGRPKGAPRRGTVGQFGSGVRKDDAPPLEKTK